MVQLVAVAPGARRGQCRRGAPLQAVAAEWAPPSPCWKEWRPRPRATPRNPCLAARAGSRAAAVRPEGSPVADGPIAPRQNILLPLVGQDIDSARRRSSCEENAHRNAPARGSATQASLRGAATAAAFHLALLKSRDGGFPRCVCFLPHGCRYPPSGPAKLTPLCRRSTPYVADKVKDTIDCASIV